MESDSRAFLLPSPDLERLLSDNGTSIVDLLQAEGSLDASGVSQARAANPVLEPGSLDRDPVTIMIASAALIASLTPLISKALSVLTGRREVIVKKRTLEERRDADGTIVKSADGKPLYVWTDYEGPITPAVLIKGFGFEIRIGNSVP